MLTHLPSRLLATALRSLRPPESVIHDVVLPRLHDLVTAGDVLTAAPIIAVTQLHHSFDVAALLEALTLGQNFDVASKLARAHPDAATATIPTLIDLLEKSKQVRKTTSCG